MLEIIIVNVLVLALRGVTAPLRLVYNILAAWPRGMARKLNAVLDYPSEIRLARHETLMSKIPRGRLDGRTQVTARGLNFRVPVLAVVDGGQSIH